MRRFTPGTPPGRTRVNRFLTVGAASVALAACMTGALATSSQAAIPLEGSAAESASRATSAVAGSQPFVSQEKEKVGKGLDMLLDIGGLLLGLADDGGAAAIATALADIKAQLAELSTKVTNGFNQLEIDIANSRYASAQEELRPITTSVGVSYRHLTAANAPGVTPAQRKAAVAKLTTSCTKIDVEPTEFLQMYSGDPADGMSQAGLLPAAWATLVANERSVQGAKAGATPAFFTYRTMRQMRNIGAFATARISQYALVKGACDALLFDDLPSQQAAATAVHDLVVDGDLDTPGLTSISASLPAGLPRLTGVFPGAIAGQKGLVVANYNKIKDLAAGDTMRIVNVARSENLFADDAEFTLTGDALRTPTGGDMTRDGDNCLYTVGGTPTVAECKYGHTPVTVDDTAGEIHVSAPAGHLCLGYENGGPPGFKKDWQLRLDECGAAGFQWWLQGPIPSVKQDALDGIGRRNSLNAQGSPLGDNPNGASADGMTPLWAQDWRFFEPEWVDNMRSALIASGTTMGAVTKIYGSPQTPTNIRILPAVTPEPTFSREAFPSNRLLDWNDGPAWVIEAGPGGKEGGRRVIIKYRGTDIPAIRTNGDTNVPSRLGEPQTPVQLPAAHMLFGLPIDGCAFLYERPLSTGFTCPTRKALAG